MEQWYFSTNSLAVLCREVLEMEGEARGMHRQASLERSQGLATVAVVWKEGMVEEGRRAQGAGESFLLWVSGAPAPLPRNRCVDLLIG